MGAPRPIYRCRVCGVFTEEPVHCGKPAELFMTPEQRLRLSKLMSALLRHIPHEAGLQLDEQGWVRVEELARAIRERWRRRDLYQWVTPEHIVAVALLDPKGRFQLSEDMRRIRAAYGHSIRLRLGYRPLSSRELPQVLYHGTVVENLRPILREGLKPMKRLMVHLSARPQEALEAARRHGDRVVLLHIDPQCLASRGIPVYRASHVMYLASHVPPECIKRIERLQGMETPV
ncbi:RNA 2'-phosphotransferase [Pyrodictium occultum]|uniref:Probable RNA 2'-phosphotransferase n=1 Tax=Pyrodictium occultum TaxID=2309 RepID=A0A0V8RTS6_PYROC|nr:RNA 2'-phosphotransferase [Pyrodictium occultum]KSW11378.1 RNA 2'-phosphotransferase [Pyrodictium occultum]